MGAYQGFIEPYGMRVFLLGFRVSGLVFTDYGLGFRVLEFRVSGYGLKEASF